jgi:hypothetical protein
MLLSAKMNSAVSPNLLRIDLRIASNCPAANTKFDILEWATNLLRGMLERRWAFPVRERPAMSPGILIPDRCHFARLRSTGHSPCFRQKWLANPLGARRILRPAPEDQCSSGPAVGALIMIAGT